MTSPLVSILIPTFNSSNTIKRCLDSIQQQIFTNYEVLVIDGLSNDDTIEIIKSYKAELANLKWISEKDNGIYDAMNKGIQMSKGEWIYFMGSDDKFYNEKVLSQIFEMPIPNNTSFIYGKAFVMPDNFYTPIDFDFNKLVQFNICHQAIFYSRRIFDQYTYDLRMPVLADWDLNLKIFSHYPSSAIQPINITICEFSNEGVSSNWRESNDYKLFFKNILKMYIRYFGIFKGAYTYFFNLNNSKK